MSICISDVKNFFFRDAGFHILYPGKSRFPGKSPYLGFPGNPGSPFPGKSRCLGKSGFPVFFYIIKMYSLINGKIIISDTIISQNKIKNWIPILYIYVIFKIKKV